MREFPLLKNAPIIEAVIDIKVKLPDSFKVNQLDSFSDFLKTNYPTKKEVKKFEGRIDLAQEAALTPISGETAGYRCDSEDGKQVVQAMTEGFTFSRLKPYISWEQFCEEAHKIWDHYKKITSPELITRVALRYINNLNIPVQEHEFKFHDFLTAPPAVPNDIPQAITEFVTRVVVPEPSINANAIIIQALEPISKPRLLPVILDIDVFSFNTDGIDEDPWDILESLRDFKNKIFFNSITNKLEEMYK
ncbi:MAG: TIGR04255 family protein [Nitrospirota bacterium]